MKVWKIAKRTYTFRTASYMTRDSLDEEWRCVTRRIGSHHPLVISGESNTALYCTFTRIEK